MNNGINSQRPLLNRSQSFGDLPTKTLPLTNSKSSEKALSSEPPTKKTWNTIEPLDAKIAEKMLKMSHDVQQKTSGQLHIANTKIAELEKQLELATGKMNPPSVASPAPAAYGKLKPMAHAIKNAFANAPWGKIGKGALYAAAGVAAFALLSNPLGVLGMVGMVMGSGLLPTALGLAGAAVAVHQIHKWIGKKPEEDSNNGTAPAETIQHRPP